MSSITINQFVDVIIYVAVFAFFFVVLKVLLNNAHKQLEEPRATLKKDDFYREFGYSYDLVFVFEVFSQEQKKYFNEMQKKFSMKNIIDRLLKAGLQTRQFYSCQRDEIYVKIRISPERVKQEADRIDYKLKLDFERLKLKAQTGHIGVWNKIIITDEYKQSPYEPWEYIFARYDQKPELQSLYQHYKTQSTTDRSSDYEETEKKLADEEDLGINDDNAPSHPFREVDR